MGEYFCLKDLEFRMTFRKSLLTTDELEENNVVSKLLNCTYFDVMAVSSVLPVHFSLAGCYYVT